MFIASNNSTLEGYYEIRNSFTGMNLDIHQVEGVNHICKRSPNNCDSQLWTPVVGNTRIYFRLANKYLISTNSRNIFLDFDVVADMITLVYHSSNMNDDDHHTTAAWWCLKTIGDSSDIEGQASTLTEVTWPKSYESPVKLLSNGKLDISLHASLSMCIMHIYISLCIISILVYVFIMYICTYNFIYIYIYIYIYYVSFLIIIMMLIDVVIS